MRVHILSESGCHKNITPVDLGIVDRAFQPLDFTFAELEYCKSDPFKTLGRCRPPQRQVVRALLPEDLRRTLVGR